MRSGVLKGTSCYTGPRKRKIYSEGPWRPQLSVVLMRFLSLSISFLVFRNSSDFTACRDGKGPFVVRLSGSKVVVCLWQ